jgi:hypothetical protein
MNKGIWRACVVTLFLMASVFATVTVVHASAGSPTLSMSAREDSGAGASVVLTAKLAAANNLPMAGDRVTFLLRVDEFAGGPLETVGSGVTDGSGTAQFNYTPTWTGKQDFSARWDPGDGGAVVTANASIDVASAVTAYNDPGPAVLAGVGRDLVVVLLILVAVVWLILLGVVGSVWYRMPRAALAAEPNDDALDIQPEGQPIELQPT